MTKEQGQRPGRAEKPQADVADVGRSDRCAITSRPSSACHGKTLENPQGSGCRREDSRPEHYGLEKVGGTHSRILGSTAAGGQAERPDPVPGRTSGVGKTSLGQSIARSTNRKFVHGAGRRARRSGNCGHRRTYRLDAGKILQNMTRVGVRNPLFLLDEVDKMGADSRGDLSWRLLEVPDPEQNFSFVDHYIEVEYDLSDVMFVATANSLNIPAPLLDRMEIIRLAGYTEDEKVNIAERYLVPEADQGQWFAGRRTARCRKCGARYRPLLHARGRVRSLDREIAKIARKVVKNLLKRDRDKTKGYRLPRAISTNILVCANTPTELPNSRIR